MSRDERALEAGLTDPAIPPALATGTLEIVGLMPNSSNYTFLAKAGDGGTGDPGILAIYKPRRGETPVPPTVLRDGSEGIGSVQLFIEVDPRHHYFTLEESHAEEFRKVALFDHVANNADRKAGHCLLGSDGRIWVIDHGVCFSDEPKLRTVIWAFLGEPIPPSLLDDLRRLIVTLDAGGAVLDTLRSLLEPAELAAVRARADALLSAGCFPEPGPGRPYPWPPV